MKKILTIALAILATLPLFADEYEYHRNIRYYPGQPDDPVRTLDIAMPVDLSASKVHNIIVWFHGGGLTAGHKEIPSALEKDGNVIIGVEYRLYPQASVAEILDDCAAALSWVMDNGGHYGAWGQKIFIAGHSAGGYVVAMLALDKKYLAKYGKDPDKLAAVIPYSGQAITHYTQRASQGIGALDPKIDDLAPIAHLRSDAPPMFIISGDRELEMNGRYEENAYFVRMLRLNGHKNVKFVELQGFDHGSMAAPGHLLLLKYLKEFAKQ